LIGGVSAEVQPPVIEDPHSHVMNARALELGIDLGLIDENLRLTPLERMRQHDRCVRQILAVQERLGVASHHGS
jgi:hypothetical protein